VKKITLLLLLLVPLQANSVLITTSVGQYDVSAVTTPFASSSDLLRAQVWWSSQSLAAEFADLIGSSLGLPNGSPTGIGPVFAYVDGVGLMAFCTNNQYPFCGGDGVHEFMTDPSNLAVYAIATMAAPSEVAEPGTISLFAAGLMTLGFIRRGQRKVAARTAT
jgi:hypothetical protein